VPVRVLALALATVLVGSRAVAHAGPLTLADALAAAHVESPALAAARADVEAARGRRAQVGVPLVANPVLTLDGAHHAVGPDAYFDRDVMLGQEFEIGGQRGLRIAAADHDVQSAELKLADRRRTLDADVWKAWVELVAADRRRAVALEEQRLTARLAEIARQRARTGDASGLDVTLATVESGRAAQALADADTQRDKAAQALADAIGGPGGTAVAALDDAHVPPAPAPADALVARALATRPDLLAAREERARLDGEADVSYREGVVPNVVLRGFYRRELANERTAGGEVELPLPTWNRQEGTTAALRAQALGAGAEVTRLGRSIPREVETARTRLVTARATWQRLSSETLPAAAQALELLQRGYAAGYLALPDVLVQQQRLLDTRRDAIGAWTELREAEADLAAAVGGEDVAE